ncbi:hypothetical protein CJF42_23140 [Pseudoalteromonas sp. NBT06-2]|uniref:DUF2024 family protein n=1 Tax=Pseudoalteromonas sp. NBT06-2 TaxID=2025950 RepID=UPI000BA577A0|nr:DUF2024 family protein [Pseudoalteromonas sp. NBT06-2]PAJ72076.1 hypothetical protein CJF42_23140 [Pseudoalteromonas sp. NBT06-2]
MQVHVYDTHVTTADEKHLHFDVLVDDDNKDKVQQYVLEHLASKEITPKQIKHDRCQFCHSEIANPQVRASIEAKGYYIISLSEH